MKTNGNTMNNKQKALHLLLNKGEKDNPLNFDQQLEQNIKTTCDFLQIYDSQIQHLLPELKYNENCYESVRWKYIALCFHLVSTTDDNAEIQSVNHMIDVKRSFQFIISLGLLPNLIPGVGLDMSLRFKNADKFPLETVPIKDKYHRLCYITEIILNCLDMSKLRNYLIENHLNDIFAALLQLTAAPLKKVDENDPSSLLFYTEVIDKRKELQTRLHDVVLNTHQPLVFRELMFLFGNKKSPIWLKNIVLQILMERLEARNGVESFIRAVLDVQTDDVGTSWKHWDVVTKILMTKPKYVNENDYFKNICGQLMKLLYKKTFDGSRIKNFERAVVLCTKYLYNTNEPICVRYLINPLVETLLKYSNKIDVETVRIFPSEEIERNVGVLKDVFEKTDERNVSITHLKPIILILFNLLHSSMSLKELSQEISELLTNIINELDTNEKHDYFNYFIFVENPKSLPDIRKKHIFDITNETIHFVEGSLDHNPFSRVSTCVKLLETTNNDNLICSFVTYLLTIFVQLFNKPGMETIEKKLVITQLLSKLLENKQVLKNIKTKSSELLIFSENILRILTEKKTHTITDYDDEQFQTLFLILMITNTLVENSDHDIKTEFTILNNILEKIQVETLNSELKVLINEILSTNKPFKRPKTDYDIAIDEICSHLIPEQAHGLATLVNLINRNDPQVGRRKQYVLNIFQQQLKSEESFIYLRAIAGLSAMANSFPNIVLETLTDEYVNPKGESLREVETRMKLGEVLVRTTAGLGEIVVKHKALLLNTFMTVIKDDDPLIRASALSNLGQVCEVLGFRLGTMINPILDCIYDIITNDLAVEVRRAAITVIRQLFIGLDKDLLTFLKEDVLPIYRTLKKMYHDDPDDVTRLQAQLAIEELNKIMKDLLAPEIKFEKVINI